LLPLKSKQVESLTTIHGVYFKEREVLACEVNRF